MCTPLIFLPIKEEWGYIVRDDGWGLRLSCLGFLSATLGFTRCLKFLDSTGFREGLGFKV